MKTQMLLLAASIMGSVWFCTPRGVDPIDLQATTSAIQTDEHAKSDSAYASWSAGETVLERSDDGHFYADVTVSGSPMQMMVDTGASFIALTGEDAAAIGLDWSETDMRVVADGASGPVRGVMVQLDEVELNGHIAHDVRAAVIPEGLGVSLLGQSFLSQIDRVSIADGKMILGG